MRTNSRLRGAALSLLILSCGPRAGQAPVTTPQPLATDPLGSLAWLAGTWVSDDPSGPRTVEHWMAPEGGTMIGVNRTTHAGQTLFFEYLRIESDAGETVYLASPRGRDPPTRFRAVDAGPSWITFEAPEHDYPQRIEYRREGDGLRMRISGVEHGAAKSSTWAMHRLRD